jgi:ABC-type lipoprotein release transport system permease subunit
MSRRWSIALCAAVVCLATVAGQEPATRAAGATADVLISRHLAEAQGLKDGDVIRLSADATGVNPRAFRVRGVYEPTPDPLELNDAKLKVRLHLPDLLSMTAREDDPLAAETVDALNIALTNPADAAAFSRDLMARVPGVLARPIQRAMGRASVFVVLERFHLAIALVTIFASTVFLLALSVMVVDERRETVGVLRLIGLTTRRVLAQVFVEGLVIAAGGALFGLVLAVGSEQIINRYFQWHYNTTLIFVRVTPTVAMQCLLIAVPLGVLASVTASWLLLRRQVMALARR